jgi:MoaA/NifB/PqqE/SkfB family radical SAM enzyme/glycosyltransferase involved in cell wall biosynthesis
MDISVIIPSYNRKDKLKACLDSLSAQAYPAGSFEVIVIDDGSTDGTREMLEALTRANAGVRFAAQQHKGPAAARNLGARLARSGVIGFTDDDCIVDRAWISKMVEAHRQDPRCAAVGGSTEVDPGNMQAQVSQFLSDGAIQTRINGSVETIFFPTCNVSIKKEFFGKGFNEHFPLPAGEDLDFFWTLFKAGGAFAYRKDIKVFHNCHTDPVSFFKQAFMYGRGNYLVQYIHRDHPLLKEIKPGGFFVFLCSLAVNFLKIPRFAFIQGGGLVSARGPYRVNRAIEVYLSFFAHKVAYLAGTVCEYFKAPKLAGLVSDGCPRGARKAPDKPEFVILDITHRCNLKCNVCEIRKDKPAPEFTLDEVRKLIQDCVDWGVKDFVLSGGEPLIRNDIFDILDFVRLKKYHVGILTNGVILSAAFIDKLLPYLASNTVSLSISLDALTPGIHDDIRGGAGCFEKTLNAFKVLSAHKQRYPGLNFNSISIILNENLEELAALARALKALNVNSIQFQPLLANNLVMKQRANNVKYWIPADRLPALDRAVDQLLEFKRENPGLVVNSERNLTLVKKYFRGQLRPSDIRCLYGARTMLIANNGLVTTCLGAYGDIRARGIRRIFESAESEEARKKVSQCKSPCLLPCFTD